MSRDPDRPLLRRGDGTRCAVVEAVAEIHADLEGLGSAFRDERDGVIPDSDPRHRGIYEGGLSLARDLIAELERRGISLTARKPDPDPALAAISSMLDGLEMLRAISDNTVASGLPLPPSLNEGMDDIERTLGDIGKLPTIQ